MIRGAPRPSQANSTQSPPSIFQASTTLAPSTSSSESGGWSRPSGSACEPRNSAIAGASSAAAAPDGAAAASPSGAGAGPSRTPGGGRVAGRISSESGHRVQADSPLPAPSVSSYVPARARTMLVLPQPDPSVPAVRSWRAPSPGSGSIRSETGAPSWYPSTCQESATGSHSRSGAPWSASSVLPPDATAGGAASSTSLASSGTHQFSAVQTRPEWSR